MIARIALALLCILSLSGIATAQQLQRVPACGEGSPGPGTSPGTQDPTGLFCGKTATLPAATTPVAGAQYGLAVASSTALTVPASATAALITIEGTSVRYADDGTTPTPSVGQGPFVAGYVITLTGAELAAARFIQTSASATINVSYYK